jgi:DNA-binding NtrC family response regulator
LEVIRRNPNFDLVLSDVIMPQMSGKELSEKIRMQCPHTKILLMSGYTDDALAHHGVLDEGLLFLEKPFSPVRLAGKVREILDTPRGAVEDFRIKGNRSLAYSGSNNQKLSALSPFERLALDFFDE